MQYDILSVRLLTQIEKATGQSMRYDKGRKSWKNQGKVREFRQEQNVETMRWNDTDSHVLVLGICLGHGIGLWQCEWTTSAK